jgi:hypothetical protein
VKDLRSYHYSNFVKIVSLVEVRNKLSVDSDLHLMFREVIGQIKGTEEEVSIK